MPFFQNTLVYKRGLQNSSVKQTFQLLPLKTKTEVMPNSALVTDHFRQNIKALLLRFLNLSKSQRSVCSTQTWVMRSFNLTDCKNELLPMRSFNLSKLVNARNDDGNIWKWSIGVLRCKPIGKNCSHNHLRWCIVDALKETERTALSNEIMQNNWWMHSKKNEVQRHELLYD